MNKAIQKIIKLAEKFEKEISRLEKLQEQGPIEGGDLIGKEIDKLLYNKKQIQPPAPIKFTELTESEYNYNPKAFSNKSINDRETVLPEDEKVFRTINLTYLVRHTLNSIIIYLEQYYKYISQKDMSHKKFFLKNISNVMDKILDILKDEYTDVIAMVQLYNKYILTDNQVKLLGSEIYNQLIKSVNYLIDEVGKSNTLESRKTTPPPRPPKS